MIIITDNDALLLPLVKNNYIIISNKRCHHKSNYQGKAVIMSYINDYIIQVK